MSAETYRSSAHFARIEDAVAIELDQDDRPAESQSATLVIRQSELRRPEDDLETSVRLLREVASGAVSADHVVRIYTPRPTLALSRRESHMPGFDQAVRAGRLLGFTPVVRPTGGRAVAYDESCLIVDVVSRDSAEGSSTRFFERTTTALIEALRGLGVDARVGAVEGEYCPGDFSINARGAVKLMGTSQRAIRGARLLSGMLPFGPVETLAQVVGDANTALGLEWDRATFGTLRDEAQDLERQRVESAVVGALAQAER